MRRIGLRAKFILSISLILLVVFGLIGYFLVRNARNTITANLNRNTIAFATLASQSIGNSYEVYKDSGTLRIRQEINTYTKLDTNVTNVSIVDVTGHQVYSLVDGQPVHVPTTEASQFDPSYHYNADGQIVLVVQPYSDSNGFHSYAIVYAISTTEVTQAMHQQELSISTFVLVGLMLSALVTYELLNQLFIRPIQTLSQQSATISSGDYNQQVELEREDEIGALALSVNHMASVLKANIDQLKAVDKMKSEFIMIASHNLRTPLTIIEGGVETLGDIKLDEKASRLVDAIESNAQRLNSFAEQMIIIASIEAGHRLETTDAVSLRELVEPLRAPYGEETAAKQLSFDVQLENGDTVVHADRHQLSQAIRNLLENAIKFTEHGSVTLQARSASGEALIIVKDTGVGIAADEMHHLFTKFHRGTSTLTYDFEGTGIGLYAAKLIVEQYGGHIAAQSEPGKGSTFTIHVPLAPAAQAKPAAPAKPTTPPNPPVKA